MNVLENMMFQTEVGAQQLLLENCEFLPIRKAVGFFRAVETTHCWSSWNIRKH